MIRRTLTVAVGVLLALPLTAVSASAADDCKPATCRPPVWCDGTGYSCDATGLALYLLDGAGGGSAELP